MMKTNIAKVRMQIFRSKNGGAIYGTVAGFSVVEMLLASAILAILVTWMVSSQLYAMRVYTLAQTKLVATAGARQVITTLRDQIREANSVYVGNCSSSWNTYADVTNGALMQGNAIEIYPTANTNPFEICYLENTAGTNHLMLYNSGQGTINDLCDYITNQMVFDAEDMYGNILTSNVDNRVIGITMQLSQWQYPIARIGSTNFNYYNFYQLRTRATRRAIN